MAMPGQVSQPHVHTGKGSGIVANNSLSHHSLHSTFFSSLGKWLVGGVGESSEPQPGSWGQGQAAAAFSSLQ